MGAPTGEKTTLGRLPAVVWDVLRSVRRSFAQIYVRNRGLRYPDKSTTQVQVKRPESFIAELRDVLDDVLDEPIGGAHTRLTISADAARELGVE